MSERPSRSEARKALGERLRQSAKDAGYTSDSLAEALGVQGGSVRGWWVGRNEPSYERLRRYADLVKVSVSYLLLGAEEVTGPVGTLQEWRIRFADLVAQGVDPAEAIDRISGPESATAEEKAILTDGAAAMREVLAEHSEGRWADLTDDQRAAVLEVIRSMARANRGDRAPPDDPSSG